MLTIAGLVLLTGPIREASTTINARCLIIGKDLLGVADPYSCVVLHKHRAIG